MVAQSGRQRAPLLWGDVTEWVRKTAQVANEAIGGRIDSIGEITLTTSTSVTTLVDARLSPESVVLFDPMTASAASEKASGALYVLEANRSTSAWVVTHSLGPTTDRIFRYVILG